MGASDQGFRYMSGGIGLEEREIMLGWEADYTLKLAFAELSGDYLSNVKVHVAGRNGKEVLSMTTNGPWLYIKLPPGTFDVKATFEGETRQIENLHLPKGNPVTRLLHWDLEEESQPVGD
ncbi:MAG TPA: carboxypeptidase regulatory-like domain-containing protein [Candidatus Binatia bacterium]|nr:carboxypeptidase regulatory-like domain-containing protein [Candidatus Binatia bacterium]